MLFPIQVGGKQRTKTIPDLGTCPIVNSNSVPVLIYAPRYENIGVIDVTATGVLNLDTIWRWVTSFAFRPLYSQGNGILYPLDRRLGGTPDPVWTLWRREKSLNITDFWVLMPCSSETDRCFGGTYRMCLQDRRVSQARNLTKVGWKFSFCHLDYIPFYFGSWLLNLLYCHVYEWL
jgi:hypothetical protein